MLGLKPDMASLAVGSNNFPTRVYENSPDLVDWLASEMLVNKVKPEIEAFDLSHIFQAVAMAGPAKLKAPLYVQFVMGVKNAMPVDRPVFDFYIETLKRLAPDAEWCGAGIGRHQITLNEWCVALGGHARTGLEDNVRLDRDTLAPSNAALVRRVVELCDKHDRPVATLEQARASSASPPPPTPGRAVNLCPVMRDPRICVVHALCMGCALEKNAVNPSPLPDPPLLRQQDRDRPRALEFREDDHQDRHDRHRKDRPRNPPDRHPGHQPHQDHERAEVERAAHQPRLDEIPERHLRHAHGQDEDDDRPEIR